MIRSHVPRLAFWAVLLLGLWGLGQAGWWGPATVAPVAAEEDGGAKKHTDGFIGAAACASCHAQAHAHWLTSSHAQTFEPVSKDNLPASVLTEDTVTHAPGSTRFVQRGDGGFHAETMGPGGTKERYDMTHVVGRMRVQMFVATMEDGRQQVLPGMYEVPRDAWFDYTKLIFGGPGSDWDTPPIVKPGEPSFWTGTVRAWGPRCARCHVSGWEPHTPRAEGMRYSQRQLGVDCESCHGPGHAHSVWHEQRAAGKTGELATPKDPILRYQDLAHDRAVSACLQCHMESDQIDRQFQVGDDIFAHADPTLIVSPERIDPYGRVLELIYDGMSFSASRCVQEGKLTCFTCHHPHGSEHPSQLRASPEGAALCIECHKEQADAGRTHTGHDPNSSGSSCVGCHMPFLWIERGHGVVADHSISIPRLDMPGDRVAQDACTACHNGGDLATSDAPKLDKERLQLGYEAYWPKPTPPHAWQVAFANARTGSDDGAQELLKVLDDPKQYRVVRASAAALLRAYASEVPLALMLRTKDADPLVRATAIRSLATLEGAPVDALLQAAFADEARGVRIAAARAALEGWTRARANPALVKGALPILEADAKEVPTDWVRWFVLAGAYDIAGRIDDAVRAYRNVALLDPYATHVRRRIGELEKMKK